MGYHLYSEIVESNGKTIRENNLEIQHKFPLGSIVTLNFDNTVDSRHGIGYKGQANLYVVGHHRDCDGEPLYSLASIPVQQPSTLDPEYFRWKAFAGLNLHGYGESSLQDTGRSAKVFYNNVQEYFHP